jgi:hypothetical protein
MATYNLRRFAHADGLKAIAHEHLLALLNPHKPYFDGRGLTLPPPSASDGIDYDQLVNVLDVSVQKFVDAVKEFKPAVVALSGFLTLAFDSMKATVEALAKAGLRDKIKIMIGGGRSMTR